MENQGTVIQLSLWESLFSPNLNLVPFVDGISMGYILNVICFMPLGFLVPLISRIYEKAGKEQDCNGCWYLPVITTGIAFLATFIS